MATIKYGDLEYESSKVAAGLARNAKAYINNSNLNEKEADEVYSSIQDMIGRVESGDIDSVSYSGQGHSNSNFTNNPRDKRFLGIKTGKGIDANGLAADYLWQYLQGALDSLAANKKEKTKYSNIGLDQAFFDLYFGGNSPDETSLNSVWLDLDKTNDEGKRSRENRLSAYASLLENYANNSKLDDYDYEGSAFRNADAYREKLRLAALAARNGDFDAFTKAYAATGGNMSNFNAMFTEGNLKPAEKSAIELAREVKLQEYKDMGITDLTELNKLMKAYDDKVKQKLNEVILEATEDVDWQKYASDNFTSTAQAQYNLNNINGGKSRGDAFWLGNYGNASGKDGGAGEYDKESYFNKHKRERNDILNKINSGLSLGSDNIGEGVSESELGAVMMHYLLKSNPDEFIPASDGSYIYKTSIKKDGTAYRYNPKTRTLYLYHNKGKETKSLNDEYKRRWKKSRTSSNSGKYKDGGILNKLKILKAATGADFDAIVNLKSKTDHAKVKAEAKNAGKTEKLYRAGNRHISKDSHDNWDLAEFNDSDYARLIGLGSDIAGLLASFTGVGTIANIGTGLTSTAANLYADISDGSVSGTDALKGLGLNLGLSAVGFLPGGNTFRILKTAAKFIPKIMALYNAAGLAMDPEVQKSWAKTIHSGDLNRMTVQDWKNIAASISSIRSITHMATNKYKSSKYAKQTGKQLTNGPESVEKVNTKSDLGENAGIIAKTKAGISDAVTNLKNRTLAWVKSKIAPSYNYDIQKVRLFRDSHIADPSKNAFMELLKGKGKYSDALIWLKMQGINHTNVVSNKNNSQSTTGPFTPTEQVNVNRVINVGNYVAKRHKDVDIQNPKNLIAGIQAEKLTTKDFAILNNDPYQWKLFRMKYNFKRGGKINQLQSLKTGGIIKAIRGGDFLALWKYSLNRDRMMDQVARMIRNISDKGSIDFLALWKYRLNGDRIMDQAARMAGNTSDKGSTDFLALLKYRLNGDRIMDQAARMIRNTSDKGSTFNPTLHNKSKSGTNKVFDDAWLYGKQFLNNRTHPLEFVNHGIANKEAKDVYNTLSKSTAPLDIFTQINDNVRGDFLALLKYRLNGDRIMDQAARMAGNTSDLTLAYATSLEGATKQADEYDKGWESHNNAYEKSKELVRNYRDRNIQGMDALFNTNNGRLSALHNQKLGYLAELQLQLAANNMQLHSKIIYDLETNKLNNINKLKIALTEAMERSKDAALKSYQNKLASITDPNSAEYKKAMNDYITAANNWKETEGRNFENQIYAVLGIYIPKTKSSTLQGYDYQDLTNKPKIGRKGMKLKALKSGHKISDDGPVKTRNKDADRFRKRNKHVDDSNHKHLDRIGKLIEMYAKKAIG